jgi:hypothetical protein
MSEIQLNRLRLGEVIETGGQGMVYAVEDPPNTAFKRYHKPSDPLFNEQALAWLVEERTSISLAGVPVDEWAAWPTTVVRDGARTVGFLMPLVPPDFYITIGGKPKLAHLHFVASTPGVMWADVPLPSDEQCVQLVAHLAGAVRALHHRGAVIGDISFGNIVWASAPRPRVMLLDCDGMRRGTRPPVLPQAETPDWVDPLAPPNTPPTSDRDCYKLALAVMRVLTRDLTAAPTPQTTARLRGLSGPDADRVLALLRAAAGPAGSRPKASEWVAALSARESVAVGRPTPRTIDAPPAKPELLGDQPRTYRPVDPPR